MDLHVFPIPIPPPTSLSTQFLWVFPVHQARALVSCIQPGLAILFPLLLSFLPFSLSLFLPLSLPSSLLLSLSVSFIRELGFLIPRAACQIPTESGQSLEFRTPRLVFPDARAPVSSCTSVPLI